MSTLSNILLFVCLSEYVYNKIYSSCTQVLGTLNRSSLPRIIGGSDLVGHNSLKKKDARLLWISQNPQVKTFYIFYNIIFLKLYLLY